MNEREVFEAWISTKEFIHAGMGCRSVEDILIFDEDYQSYHFRTIQECWEAWQYSANREGYKLVPLEPTPKMIDSTWDHDYKIYDMSSNDRNEFIYKAMIGAVDDH